MNRYKITLKPLDWFFFGGEQTFDNGETQSFIAFSNHMPQQTTLLGMVRYQLLKQSGLLLTGNKEDDYDAKLESTKDLVGSCSFDIESSSLQKFGKILNLSPVFIQKGEHRLMPIPLSYGMNVLFKEEKVWMSGKTSNQIIHAPEFNEKYYTNYCKYIDDSENVWFDDDIFVSSMQIGITKAGDADANENGFFKQMSVRFKDNDTSFAFYLELEDGVEIKNDFVFMGAQRSCFKMDVIPNNEQLFIPNHPEGSILLCSPSYIDDTEELNKNCLQHWSGSIHFRNMHQRTDGQLNSGAVNYHRYSSLCSFLSAGSVIFYEESHLEILKKLLCNSNLQQIGYNIFNVK